MNLRFTLINIFILLTLIALMQFTFPVFSDHDLPHLAFHFLFVYLFLSSQIGTFILEKNMHSSPKKFINAFMAISSLRMLLAVIIIVILILKVKTGAKFLAVYFVFGYLSFLVAEVVYLFKRSKKKI